MVQPTRTVVIHQVLMDVDGPDLVLAADPVGTAYLCLLTARSSQGDHFIAVPASARRVQAVRSGVIDILTAMTTPESLPLLEGWFARVDGKPAIHLNPVNEFEDRWLPASGLLVTDFEPPVAEGEAIAEAARARSAAIILRMNPPEARGVVPKMDAENLAGVIRSFQLLVKYSVQKLLTKNPELRERVGSEAYTLQVPAFSQGSFKIHFEARNPHLGLFGQTVVGEAMARIDELFDLLGKPVHQMVDGIQKHRGFVVGAYRQLLRLVADHNMPLEYRWADPSMSEEIVRSADRNSAAALCALLDERQELGTEEVRFLGIFTKADTTRRSWAVRALEGPPRRKGLVHPDFFDVLSGVTIETQQYEVVCEERLAQTPDGRSTTKLFLKSATPVPNSGLR